MIEEEKTYNKLIKDLKNLPKVEAPKNFETELWRKINSSVEEKKPSFWEKFFSPRRFVPAAVVIASAVIIFFVVNINSDEVEDPLNLEPKLREDLVVAKNIPEESFVPLKKLEKKKESKSEVKKNIEVVPPQSSGAGNEMRLSKEGVQLKDEALEQVELKPESLKTDQAPIVGGNVAPAPVKTSTSDIKKDSLNFMQINLSPKEKQEVEQLKQRIQHSEKAKSK